MSAVREHRNSDANLKKLKGAMLEHAGLAFDRMPGLAQALDQFVVEAPKCLVPLFNRLSDAASIEAVLGTTLFQALGDCGGLTAAIYASEEPEARLLIALDERIDDLIAGSIFGESLTQGAEDDSEAEAPRSRTAIETALLEEFARALGRALEAAFSPFAQLSLKLDRVLALNDVFALGRRDTPAAAARFSLPMEGRVYECLVLLPQSFLLPLRKELDREQKPESPSADRRWSLSMETGVKQTRLPVTAILEELPMRLGDIAHLRKGAVLPLRDGGFNSVRLECSGRGMFICKLGQGDGRYRLEIGSTIASAPEPVMR